jgi:tetratricopeptide (TPR) repeat protein
MKIIITLLSLLNYFSYFANDGKYAEQMGKQIQALYAAKSPEEFQNIINVFDRIAAAEKNRWEPYYYSAFGNIMLSNYEKEGSKKDTYLDGALASLEKAKSISPNESELVALEGFVHMMRVTIDPATRGPQYSGLAMQAFGKALALNPDNPRALTLMAQMQFGTAKFFNSPTTEACQALTKGLEKFETYKSENPLAPQWGKNMALGLKEQCK